MSASRGAWPTAALFLSAENPTGRRDPVMASALGDGQVYRMQGRRIELGVTVNL